MELTREQRQYYHSIVDEMKNHPKELDKYDLSFQWGNYGINVLKFHLHSFISGDIVASHKHSEYELHYIPKGKGIVIIEDQIYPFQDGMMYFTGPNVIHRQEVDHDEPMSELCFHFDFAKIPLKSNFLDFGHSYEVMEAEKCLNKLQELPLFPVFDTQGCMPLFIKAHQVVLSKQFGMYSLLKSIFIELLIRTVCCYEATPSIEIASKNIKETRFAMGLQHIKDNYNMPITIEQVANKLHLSPRQLQRIFKEIGHENFSEYLERYRLEQVCKSLVYTNLSIDEIAFQHGFSSGSYLHYVFKKRYGVTPRQYRKNPPDGYVSLEN
jgi:AraC-like DNA-binding protein